MSPTGPTPADPATASRGPELTAEQFSAAVSAVTSAFGDPTRREIYLFVRYAGGTVTVPGSGRDGGSGVTATEVAEHFALHPNVARHHLDKLAAGGYLAVEVDRTAASEGRSGVGRPSKRYRPGRHDGPALALEFPARRDDLLITLLARALGMLDPDRAELMAEDVGFQYGLSLAAQMAPGDGHRSVQFALHAVADALTAHGFAAHTERREGSLAIVAEQCPFGDAAVQHPFVCAVDRGIVRGMLAALSGDVAPATERSRPKGDDVCVTTVA
ncbi:MAG: helix-turn-helix transcriptional regulator [Acidimicrobiales bacterium]